MQLVKSQDNEPLRMPEAKRLNKNGSYCYGGGFCT